MTSAPVRHDGVDGCSQLAVDPARGRSGLIIALSVLVGLSTGVGVLVLPIVPARASLVCGGVLLAFALGWVALAVLSARFTDRPQWWALAPAAFLAVAAAVAMAGSGVAGGLFGWLLPPVLFALVVWMARRARRDVSSRTGRWLLYPVIIVLGLAAVGGVYAGVRDTLVGRAQPMPGLLFDVGGHRLHLHCTGTGSPTVVLEPGLGGTSADLHWIAPAVAAETRTCVYDRAGRGWSEAADGPQDAAHVAADLHTLLARAHEEGPYVLAGHSFGGLYALSFAAQFPDQVAGLVLLDSTAPAAGRDTSASGVVERVSVLVPAVDRLGAERGWGSSAAEFLEGSASVRQAASMTGLGDRPLIVVTADRGHDAAWFTSQRRLATLSTNSVQRVAHASHQSLIADEHDSSAPSRAIRDVVVSIRQSRDLGSR